MVNICSDKPFELRRHLDFYRHFSGFSIVMSVITNLQWASTHSIKCHAPWFLGQTFSPLFPVFTTLWGAILIQSFQEITKSR